MFRGDFASRKQSNAILKQSYLHGIYSFRHPMSLVHCTGLLLRELSLFWISIRENQAMLKFQMLISHQSIYGAEKFEIFLVLHSLFNTSRPDAKRLLKLDLHFLSFILRN